MSPARNIAAEQKKPAEDDADDDEDDRDGEGAMVVPDGHQLLQGP